MTLPELIRVFFAVNLNDHQKKCLREWMASLKVAAKSKNLRWTKSTNLHITLQFMPAVRTMDLPRLIQNTEKEIASIKTKIEFELGEIRLFPSPYHPRNMVLNLTPQVELAALSAAIGRGILATNYPIETRPFQGHVTLCRIKQPNLVNLDFLSKATLPDIGKIKVSEVILYRSEPQAEGSVYTPLSSIALMSSRG